MLEMSNEEILELAKKWGVEVEENSDKAGFYLCDENGMSEVSAEDLFFMETDELDRTITAALSTKTVNSTSFKEIDIGFKRFRIEDDFYMYGVA